MRRINQEIEQPDNPEVFPTTPPEVEPYKETNHPYKPNEEEK